MDRKLARRNMRFGISLFIILLALIGLVVGALARLFLPGPDPMGVGGTLLVGPVAGDDVDGAVDHGDAPADAGRDLLHRIGRRARDPQARAVDHRRGRDLAR